LFGGWVHYQRDRQSFWYFSAFLFTTTLLLIYYLNFKYGASQAPDLQLDQGAREVRDRDYFYLWSFSAWGVWAALGLLFIWESFAAFFGTTLVKVGKTEVTLPTARGWQLTSPILAVAIIPLFANWTWASRAGETDTRDFAADILNSVEPYGVLVTVGDNDTFPLWYAQEVEHIRQDVIVANTSLLNTDWYPRQIIRRPAYDYDAAKGPAIYRNTTWVKPKGPALSMTLADADSIPPYYQLQGPQRYSVGPITVTLDPAQLEQGVLQRADVFVLRMIQDGFPGRPIYFSRTSGSYARSLGLGDHTITQGLADKLFIPSPDLGKSARSDTVYMQGEGWFDLPRTKALWNDVFKAPDALIRKGHWIDRPSVGIPYLYVATGLGLSEVLRIHGDEAGAQAVKNKAMRVASAVRLDLGPQDAPPETAPIPLGDTTQKLALPVDTTITAKPPAPKKKQ
jgi:hypothetical protein